jgi:hypothetical protein
MQIQLVFSQARKVQKKASRPQHEESALDH